MEIILKGQCLYSVKDGFAILEVDNPPVNPLSEGVRVGIVDCLEKAQADSNIHGIILTGKGRSFIAGADISEFGKPPNEEIPTIHAVLEKLESSEKPVVAAINGSALGGGLETALCCNYRVSSSKGFVGLPEVNLGLLPGAGGTQRLPRIIGPSEALKMMLTGKHVPAKKAEELGIIDKITDADVIEESIKFLHDKKNDPLPKVRDLNSKLNDVRGDEKVIVEARALAAKIRKGQFAPNKIIQCVDAAINADSFDEGMQKEQEFFIECLLNPQREAMIHIFFSERAASKIQDVPKETEIMPINKAAIIGSGTMGGGIAMCFANAGIPVHIIDQDENNLERGVAVIKGNYDFMMSKGRINENQKDAVMGLITSGLEYDEIADADIVIEAVYENLDLKKEIFKKLDEVVKKDAILASNTSGLDIDALAQVTNRPEMVVGTHFFSPANIMRLLEVVRAEKTSDQVLATIMSVGKKLKKAPVVSLNAPGFIGNRMLFGYTTQANKLLLEGALPHQIDSALENFGMSMGPFRMMDLVGLDLGWRARKLSKTNPPVTALINDALCEQDRFGQKTNKGFYNYKEGSRAPHPAPENEQLYEKVSEDNGYKRREISDTEIVDRCILALVNEGAKILEEGVSQRSGDMDVVYINGYGFPIWRGGPMQYANMEGLEKVSNKIDEFAKNDPDFWSKAEIIEQLSKENGRFGEAPKKEERKEKLSFNQTSVAKNF